MFSNLRSIWVVFLHMFHKRETVLYPEQKAYLPPRWRGRIVLTRDPDAAERCVGCYLCAAACPVGCMRFRPRRMSMAGGMRKPFASISPLHLLPLL